MLRRGYLSAGKPATLATMHSRSVQALRRVRHFSETRTVYTTATAEQLFGAVCRLGGAHGWLAWNGLWRLRGAIDRALGGPGMRGRPTRDDSGTLYVGEVVDFWRVVTVRAPDLVCLAAEMKVPGRAWLDFRAEPDGAGTRFTMVARFEAHGLFGLLYWYAMAPAHLFLFSDLAAALVRDAQGQPLPRTFVGSRA